MNRRQPRVPFALYKKRNLPVLADVSRAGGRGADVPDGPLLRVGDLAQETNKSVRAIRFYEEMGLLRPSGRSKGQFRLFDSDAVARVRWISKLQELGMSLNDIRAVLDEWSTMSAPGAMGRIREVYRKHLDDARCQLERLANLERELTASIAYLESCGACDPGRLVSACLECDAHDDEVRPDLVAGLLANTAISECDAGTVMVGLE